VRIHSIRLSDVPPVQRFEVEGLTDVVVLAGANGVGKTRLMQALVQAFRKPTHTGPVRLGIEATSKTEQEDWGKRTLDTGDPADCQLLARTLQKSHWRTQWQSSVVYFESDRSIQRLQPYTFSWDVIDPWEENIGWELTFGGLQTRFQDTLHSLFRKVQSRRDKIARKAEELMHEGATQMSLDFPDPLLPFKVAFAQLLAPKRLLDAEPKAQQLRYELNGQELDVSTLSSGEREVVNTVFDFILRSPSHCIVFFDEPELHLHPELVYKLLQTLRAVGRTNQFVFCTHSPDIITAALDQSVVFISPPQPDAANQAVLVREEDETNQALRLLGHSVGIVALGKRIVLVEGTNASLDKQAYGQILGTRHPGLVLVPAGGKDAIRSFAHLVSHVLDRTIWGVDFFMLCDGDAGSAANAAATSQRLKTLPRYHLENYFLDANLIADCFEAMEPPGSWLRNPDEVNGKLRELATGLIPYAVALIVASEARAHVGNADIMPSGLSGQTADQLATLLRSHAEAERARVCSDLDPGGIADRTSNLYADLERAISADDPHWMRAIPGRPLLNKFASAAGVEPGRLKLMYLVEAAKQDYAVFADVLDIFEQFSNVAAT